MDEDAVVLELPLPRQLAHMTAGWYNVTNSTGHYSSHRWCGYGECNDKLTQAEVLVNLAFAIFLCGLVATHLKIRGFDKPVRDDGVTPECCLALRRSHGAPQGMHALALWVLGSVLICWFIHDKNALTSLVGGAAHLLAFLLFAVYPGCGGEPCGKNNCGSGGCVPLRIITGIVGWVCCACGACCFGWNATAQSALAWYCFCCHPCALIFIKVARCAAFNTPLRRRGARDPPPPVQAQWFPAVATEWADVEVVPVAAIDLAPVPVVVQPAAAEPSKFVMP
jgi:hypothetical protein